MHWIPEALKAAMSMYPGGRGRKKAVKKFRLRDGLGILGFIVLFFIVLLFLMLNGYINIDTD